jgi:hypothetical protein
MNNLFTLVSQCTQNITNKYKNMHLITKKDITKVRKKLGRGDLKTISEKTKVPYYTVRAVFGKGYVAKDKINKVIVYGLELIDSKRENIEKVRKAVTRIRKGI